MSTSTYISQESVKCIPDFLSFGCVSQGFILQLPVTLVNKSVQPQIFKIKCVTEEIFLSSAKNNGSTKYGELVNIPSTSSSEFCVNNTISINFIPTKVAPGMSTTFTIHLCAESPGNVNYVLQISQSKEPEIVYKPIRALIVTTDVFRSLRKSLLLQNKNPYVNGVAVVKALPSLMQDDRSVQTGPSVYSEVLLEDEDIDDVADMPIIGNIVWDPDEKCLKVDAELGKVGFHGKLIGFNHNRYV